MQCLGVGLLSRKACLLIRARSCVSSLALSVSEFVVRLFVGNSGWFVGGSNSWCGWCV